MRKIIFVCVLVYVFACIVVAEKSTHLFLSRTPPVPIIVRGVCTRVPYEYNEYPVTIVYIHLYNNNKFTVDMFVNIMTETILYSICADRHPSKTISVV